MTLSITVFTGLLAFKTIAVRRAAARLRFPARVTRERSIAAVTLSGWTAVHARFARRRQAVSTTSFLGPSKCGTRGSGRYLSRTNIRELEPRPLRMLYHKMGKQLIPIIVLVGPP